MTMILILVMAIIINIQIRNKYIEKNEILGIDFYSENGTKVESEALWYNLDYNSILVISYTGEMPQTVTAYLTPSGTETADKREQISIVIPNRESGKYVLIPFHFTETTMGHLEVSFNYGDYSISSDISYKLSLGVNYI